VVAFVTDHPVLILAVSIAGAIIATFFPLIYDLIGYACAHVWAELMSYYRGTGDLGKPASFGEWRVQIERQGSPLRNPRAGTRGPNGAWYTPLGSKDARSQLALWEALVNATAEANAPGPQGRRLGRRFYGPGGFHASPRAALNWTLTQGLYGLEPELERWPASPDPFRDRLAADWRRAARLYEFDDRARSEALSVDQALRRGTEKRSKTVKKFTLVGELSTTWADPASLPCGQECLDNPGELSVTRADPAPSPRMQEYSPRMQEYSPRMQEYSPRMQEYLDSVRRQGLLRPYRPLLRPELEAYLGVRGSHPLAYGAKRNLLALEGPRV